jgi:glycolate oxidase iron-sulfur subunit
VKTGLHFLDESKALACIHCGLCLSACPTYLETGDENDSPRGRIYLMRALHAGRLEPRGEVVRHIDLCLGCRACEAACPSGVQYGGLLEHTREHIEENHRRSITQRFLRRVAIEKVLPFPMRLRLALLPARAIRGLGLEKMFPKFARDMLSLLPEELSRAELPEISRALGPARGRVGLVSGCVMSAMFGETNQATMRLLNRAGWEVVVPRKQVCCGALYAHNGSLNLARAAARRNIEAFGRQQLDAIIVSAAGCGSTLKEYGALLADDPSWAARAREFSEKVKDLSEWLVATGPKVFDSTNPGRGALKPGMKVTYQDACHLAHAQRITQAPRELVKAVAGDSFVELPESDLCCGSAGTYNLTEPAMAERLQARKLQNILRTGAQIVVTANPGCLLQIQAALRNERAPVQVLHIADFLDQAMNRGGDGRSP